MPPKYDPNDASIGNALAGSEYGYTSAPLIDDPSSFAVEPTGEQMDLQFLNEPFNEAWDDSKKMLWQQKWVMGVSPTPASAAKDAKAFAEDQRKRAADAAGQRGKPMTSSEVEKLTQLDSVAYSLNVLEQKLDSIPERERGPVWGRVRTANPYDVQAQEVQNIITSITPGLARGVFNEVGVLTEPDMQRYMSLLPNPKTPPALAKKNLENLRQKLTEEKISTIDNMRKAGMDVTGFEQDYNRLVEERNARMQGAQGQQQPARQAPQPQLPAAFGGYVLKRPGDQDFDPAENNGQPYYEEQ